MIRLRFALLCLPVLFLQVGCSSSSESTAAENVDANGQTVSTVPWNKPESWETTGELGNLSH
jgi:hypothetical protein